MNPITPEIFKAIEPKKYMEKFLNAGVRSDGRMTNFRSLFEIRTNVIESSLSSASVRIGDSMIIASVKAGIFAVPEGIVLVGNQAQGQLSVACDYSLCCLGERRVAQVEGSRISKRVESVLTSRSVFDRAQLEVQFSISDEDSEDKIKTKPVWDVSIDLLIVRDDGSILDAALLAAVTALGNTKLPKINRETMKVTEESMYLQLSTIPIGVTFCLHHGKKFLADPCGDEEEVLPRIWIVVDQEKKNVLSFYGPDLPRNSACQYDPVPSFSIASAIEPLFHLISDEIIKARTVLRQ